MRNKDLTSFERLKHINESIDKIEKFTDTCNLDKFLSNPMISDAVLLKFMIIGEAIIHVQPELLDKYPYPWYKVRAFRNLIAHEYFTIKLEAVWDIVVKDIPSLKIVIEQILKNEF